jgi:hypothetical protein
MNNFENAGKIEEWFKMPQSHAQSGGKRFVEF